MHVDDCIYSLHVLDFDIIEAVCLYASFEHTFKTVQTIPCAFNYNRVVHKL